MTPQTIAVFYTRGPHFVRALQYVRRTYPGATITAIAPPGFPQDALIGQADRLVYTRHAAHSLRHPSTLSDLVAQLRKMRLDLFVVMFDTPKQRALAALSGARKRACYSADGRFYHLGVSPAPQIARVIGRNIRGRIRYMYIRHIVYHRPVEK